MKIIVIAVGLVLSLSTSVYSASFNCNKASNFAEREVCADEKLSILDDRLSELYKKIKLTEGNWREGQLAWLKERNNCKTKQCLLTAYQTRGLFFESTLTNETHNKTNVANPWGNYDEFIRLLSNHRETIVDKITYPDVCEPLVDEFIQEKVKVIQPQLILSSNAELVQYMNDNTLCSDFKVQKVEYVHGSQRPSFEIQAPYYLYTFSHNTLAYVGIMPSGAYSLFNIKTPNVIDFEGITMPYMELWDANQCQVVGGSSAPTDRGDFGFGIVTSPSLGLLSYRYEIYKYVGSSSKSTVSLRITPVLQKEIKNAYCAVSGIKNIKQGE